MASDAWFETLRWLRPSTAAMMGLLLAACGSGESAPSSHATMGTDTECQLPVPPSPILGEVLPMLPNESYWVSDHRTIALSSGSLIVPGHEGLFRVPTAGGPPEMLVPSPWFDLPLVVATPTDVFYSDEGIGLVRIRLPGGKPEVLQEEAGPLALSKDNKTLFWVKGSDVFAMTIENGVSTLACAGVAGDSVDALTVDAEGTVFFERERDVAGDYQYAILRCVPGSQPTVVDRADWLSPVVADDRYVYFDGFRANKTGKPHPKQVAYGTILWVDDRGIYSADTESLLVLEPGERCTKSLARWIANAPMVAAVADDEKIYGVSRDGTLYAVKR